MRIKKAKATGSLFAACGGFPNCKHTMKLPNGLKEASSMKTKCPNCAK
jgi:ssDNA-binding Zn-finger/Zn-ribbon topoisomerase 1